MKKTILFLPLLALIACGPNAVGFLTKIKADLKTQEDPITNVEEIKASFQSPQTQESNTQNVGIAWNYSGSINKYPIKAQINYGEGINSEGTGALQIPITGYYFYESQNTKIPLEGTCYGSGIIYFVAHTSGGNETFDGSFTRSMLDDFSGTWTKGSKKLNFYLNSK